MGRSYELENLRRAIAMLTPNQMALRREEAMRLIRELQEAEGRLSRLREGLVALLEDKGDGPW